jgi:branched-chain amino acid transport system ATP-binding protein
MTGHRPDAAVVLNGANMGVSDPHPILSVRSVSVSYGHHRALDDVSFELRRGESVAVLGSNGAGKSSLGRALAGLVPFSGLVHLGGADVTGKPAHELRRRGITYLPEGRGVFTTLTVEENLRVGVRWVGSRASRREAFTTAGESFPVLQRRRNQLARTLSGGEQQMLALARGLASNPQVVIADELSLGLAPKVVDLVFEHLDAARRNGAAIVLIEQFVSRSLAFSDRAIILRRGCVVDEGPADKFDPKDIAAQYFGD